MSRLIDADEFKKYVKNGADVAQRLFKTDEYKEFASEITEAVLWDIDEQPTVDAVEVVRCKDCKLHGHCVLENDGLYIHGGTGFCADGERGAE